MKNGTISMIMLLSVGFSLISCESFEDDALLLTDFNERTIQAVANEPVVVDILEGVATEETLEVSIQEAPTTGDFAIRGRSLGVYSTVARVGSNDQFTVRMRSADSERTITFQVETVSRAAYPFGENGAVYDRGGIVKAGESVIADVLANDAGGIQSFEIEIPPLHGAAEITEDSKIRYTASSDYTGLDDLIYKITFADGTEGRALARFLTE